MSIGTSLKEYLSDSLFNFIKALWFYLSFLKIGKATKVLKTVVLLIILFFNHSTFSQTQINVSEPLILVIASKPTNGPYR
jgi:hypothetical protein